MQHYRWFQLRPRMEEQSFMPRRFSENERRDCGGSSSRSILVGRGSSPFMGSDHQEQLRAAKVLLLRLSKHMKALKICETVFDGSHIWTTIYAGSVTLKCLPRLARAHGFRQARRGDYSIVNMVFSWHFGLPPSDSFRCIATDHYFKLPWHIR